MSVDMHPTVVPVAPMPPPPAPPVAAPRRGTLTRVPAAITSVPAVHAVSVMGAAGRCTVSVELRRADDQAVAVQEGVWAEAISHRLAAEASLQALITLEPAAGRLGVEALTVAPLGSQRVATVVLAQAAGGADGSDGAEGARTASALVGPAGDHDAIARAVLAAGGASAR